MGKKKRRPPTADQVALLAREPKLDIGEVTLAYAYAALSTCRQGGMGLSPIPMTAVWQWEDRNGITDPVLRRHFEGVISAIDSITLQRANRPQAKQEAPSKSEHPKMGGRRRA